MGRGSKINLSILYAHFLLSFSENICFDRISAVGMAPNRNVMQNFKIDGGTDILLIKHTCTANVNSNLYQLIMHYQNIG